jgi:hypothetical protein
MADGISHDVQLRLRRLQDKASARSGRADAAGNIKTRPRTSSRACRVRRRLPGADDAGVRRQASCVLDLER